MDIIRASEVLKLTQAFMLSNGPPELDVGMRTGILCSGIGAICSDTVFKSSNF
jgi:hypothetical protein